MSVETEENHHESYASRIRNLVAATRQASVAPAPAPIPQYLSVKKPTLSEESNGIQEKFTALPTPKISNSGEIKRSLITKKPEEIPVISCLSPSISSEMPRLSDEPMLGDYVESPTRREQQIQTIHVLDEDIIGKQIGTYRISKLLGVGAFSKVYIGYHTKANRFCAVKTIQKGKLLNDPRIRSSIEREIGVLKVNIYIYI